MDRGALLGIVSSVAVFIIISSIIIYNHSSFDQKLIDQVEGGVPAEKLIPQIDEETENLKTVAETRLESVVMDRKFWGNGDLASPKEYQAYTLGYEFELRIISDYDTARKKFVRREITESEFLNMIKGPKEFYNLYSNFK